MTNLIHNLENNAIHKNGFEHPMTIATFRFTEILRKVFKVED